MCGFIIEIVADLIQTGGKWLFSVAFLNFWRNVAIFVLKKYSHYSLSQVINKWKTRIFKAEYMNPDWD